jgi:hypothetical protein
MALPGGVPVNVLDPHEEQERVAADERKVVDTCVSKVYTAVSNGLASIGGLDVAAGVCGCHAGDLRRSLDRDGRRLSVDHAMAIMTRVRKFNGTVATQIASAIVYPAGLLVFPRVEMKPEEENRRLKARLLAIGQSIGVGDQLVEEALKTP